MIIMGIDPSSTVTGYAFMEVETAHLLRAGKVWATDKLYLARVGGMVHDLLQIAGEANPNIVVIEIPDGHVHRSFAGKKGSGSGLSVYGFAAGAVWITMYQCVQRQNGLLLSANQNAWTKTKKKKTRQTQIAAMFPQYAAGMHDDPGGDVSDAIGLALWGIGKYKEQERVKKEKIASEGRNRIARHKPRSN